MKFEIYIHRQLENNIININQLYKKKLFDHLKVKITFKPR